MIEIFCINRHVFSNFNRYKLYALGNFDTIRMYLPNLKQR